MLPVKYLWQNLRPSLKVKFKSFQQWPGFHLLKMNFPNSRTIFGFFCTKREQLSIVNLLIPFSPLSSSKVCVRLLTTWGGHLLKKERLDHCMFNNDQMTSNNHTKVNWLFPSFLFYLAGVRRLLLTSPERSVSDKQTVIGRMLFFWAVVNTNCFVTQPIACPNYRKRQ